MTVIPIQLGGPLWASAGFGTMGRSKRQSQPNPARMIQRNAGAADVRPLVETPKLDQRSDEALLKAYMAGERPAFTRLMGRYSNELLHFLTRFLGSRAAADDVFQETFLQIHL